MKTASLGLLEVMAIFSCCGEQKEGGRGRKRGERRGKEEREKEEKRKRMTKHARCTDGIVGSCGG